MKSNPQFDSHVKQKCQIIGIKMSGELVVITSHESIAMAEHTMRLLVCGEEFKSIEIERLRRGTINP